MDFHHIGLATENINNSIEVYKSFGYTATKIICDPLQEVNIAFLEKLNSPIIELVEPINDSSPVISILKKNGTIPYHFCYEVTNIDEAILLLRKSKFILTKKPMPAVAFDGRKVAFLYNSFSGLIELLEKK